MTPGVMGLTTQMKIYTKHGDTGETSLYGGLRVPKDDLRIRTYGTFDELNATLGIILTEEGIPQDVAARLLRVQAELFQLGAELATPRGKSTGIQLIEESQVDALESEIDEMQGKLEPLKTFILPGGVRASALTHLARTVSRRAERDMISLNRGDSLRPVILKYVNRLSDYLFVTGRYLNLTAGVTDKPWIAPK
jgi:cob(I)alamin adenosyltransferase